MRVLGGVVVLVALVACSSEKTGGGAGGGATSATGATTQTGAVSGSGAGGGAPTRDALLAACEASLEAERAEDLRLACGDDHLADATCELTAEEVERCGAELLVMWQCFRRSFIESGCTCEENELGTGGGSGETVFDLECSQHGDCYCEFEDAFECEHGPSEDFQGCGGNGLADDGGNDGNG